MALTTEEKQDLMRRLIQKMFVEANETATLTTADVLAAVDRVDDFLNVKTAAQLSGAGRINTAGTIIQNLNADLPEPFKSTATPEQKGLLLAFWAMKLTGVI